MYYRIIFVISGSRLMSAAEVALGILGFSTKSLSISCTLYAIIGYYRCIVNRNRLQFQRKRSDPDFLLHVRGQGHSTPQHIRLFLYRYQLFKGGMRSPECSGLAHIFYMTCTFVACRPLGPSFTSKETSWFSASVLKPSD